MKKKKKQDSVIPVMDLARVGETLGKAFAAALGRKAEFCEVDSRPVRVMSFKGTGVCSEICRKLRDEEITETKYMELKAARRASR